MNSKPWSLQPAKPCFNPKLAPLQAEPSPPYRTPQTTNIHPTSPGFSFSVVFVCTSLRTFLSVPSPSWPPWRPPRSMCPVRSLTSARRPRRKSSRTDLQGRGSSSHHQYSARGSQHPHLVQSRRPSHRGYRRWVIAPFTGEALKEQTQKSIIVSSLKFWWLSPRAAPNSYNKTLFRKKICAVSYVYIHGCFFQCIDLAEVFHPHRGYGGCSIWALFPCCFRRLLVLSGPVPFALVKCQHCKMMPSSKGGPDCHQLWIHVFLITHDSYLLLCPQLRTAVQRCMLCRNVATPNLWPVRWCKSANIMTVGTWTCQHLCKKKEIPLFFKSVMCMSMSARGTKICYQISLWAKHGPQQSREVANCNVCFVIGIVYYQLSFVSGH